jgi:hypothetical protein
MERGDPTLAVIGQPIIPKINDNRKLPIPPQVARDFLD